ncbi:hypothetical protein BM221_009049 [Beauveria bassiana]|uniref:Uncharacterized protein n=1 Tax=Beauveria bassiana TaxID=176275 RepID=A0A2N6NC49_BEABA|nr:hypothetical protein BM221_009049 [Beauveria bassiana]
MNGQQVPGNAGASADVSAEEARLREAMRQLKLLHVKSRLLRGTIPKMLDPLVQKQPSRELPSPRVRKVASNNSPADVMYAAFMRAVNEAQGNVKEFTELMRDEKSKEVFAMAEKSSNENPFGIKAWRHQDHPNWFNLDKDD